LPDGITWFDTPVPEFRLHVIEITGPELALPGAAPRILLCLGGSCTLRAATGQELALTRGGSCFIPFADGPVHATGHPRLIQATPGAPTAQHPPTPPPQPPHPPPPPQVPTPQRPPPGGSISMIVASFGHIAPRTGHDHELPA